MLEQELVQGLPRASRLSYWEIEVSIRIWLIAQREVPPFIAVSRKSYLSHESRQQHPIRSLLARKP